MIDDIETRLQRRLDIEPDTLMRDALTAIQGARALCAEYQAALRMCERRVARLRSVALAFRAAYYGDPAVLSLAAAWAALEAALGGDGDGH